MPKSTASILKRLFIAVLLFSAGPRFATGLAEEIEVVGMPWPLELSEPTNLSGQHPIVGKLVCPSLMRTNPKLGMIEPVLLTKLPEVNLSRATWLFEFKPGSTWWSGDPFVAETVKSVVSSQLMRAHATQYSGIWKMPRFVLKWLPPNRLQFDWEELPAFGPGILANWPMTRRSAKSEGSGFECAGTFSVVSAKSDDLKLAARDGTTRIRVTTQDLPEPARSAKRVRFRGAESFGGSPWVRMSDEPIRCNAVDLPIFVMLSWNTEIWPTDSVEFRQVLTQLTPRGELLRAGAGHLGDLLSAPILRRHPGYNKTVLVRPFDVATSVKELDRLGYYRPSPEKTRRDSKGRELILKIHVPDQYSGLIDKVVFDSFYSVGIRVERTNDLESAKLNGKLLAVFAGSNEFDWLTQVHSAAKSSSLLPGPNDEKLDQLLVDYTRSITNFKPNYGMLRDIHKRMYELEPFSVLINNRACVESNFSINAMRLDESATDPSWLLKILGIEKS